MKILKLELQNINSLKCDKPIKIDFTSEAFQNIGLFAITGPTGSGKTTILDAISIALYRKVPRFNQSFIRVGLENIVSYGAGEAFSRLTFENKGIIYEAFWSIRIKTTTGKEMKNSREVVSLKNLTSGEIIAEKKNEFSLKIEEIIQLNYDQFLRSVLLAQGEFAAFLSAKNSEKGKLLEQITGEQIYKKIGESVSNRKSDEVRSLMEIKGKINAEDLLNTEQQNELKIENSEIENSIKNIKEKSVYFADILAWFKRQDELKIAETDIAKYKEILDLDIEGNKPKTIALENNEKAEKFRTILLEKDRLNLESIKNDDSLAKAKSEENIIKIDLLKSDKLLESAFHNNKIANDTFNIWQPKIIKLSELETENNSLNSQLISENKIKIEISKGIDNKQNTLLNDKDRLTKIDVDIQEIDIFIEANKLMPDISDNLNAWSIKLNERANSNKIIEDVVSKKAVVEKNNFNIKRDMVTTEGFLQKLEKNIEQDSLKLGKIIEFLKDNPLDIVLDNKHKLGEKYKDLKRLKDSVISRAEYQKNSNSYSAKFTDIIAKIEDNAKELKGKEGLLQKEEENLALKQQIVNLHNERSKLIEGCACPLCGSENHPAVEQYKEITIDRSEQNIFLLRSEIKKLSSLDLSLKKDELEFSANIKNSNKYINELEIIIIEIHKKYDLSIIEVSKIDLLLEDCKAEGLVFKALKIDIESKTKLKEEISLSITNDTSDLSNSQKEVAVFNTKLAANKSKLLDIETIINENNIIINGISQKLSMEFLNVLLDLPEINDTEVFLKDLKSKISDYSRNTNKSIELKNTKLLIEKDISSLKDNIDEQGKRLVQLAEQIRKLTEQIKVITLERADILPLDILVKSKSDSLSLEKDNSLISYNKANTENQVNLDKQIANSSDIKSVTKSAIELNKEISELNLNFEMQLEFSTFNTKEEIQNALLSMDDKELFLKLKKELEAEIIRINHSQQLLEKDILTHNSKNTFDESKEDVELKIQNFDKEHKSFSERIGEIRQKFESDKYLREKNEDITKAADLQQIIVTKWDNLLKLLGGTKDSFNVYVQRLTLQNLINRANLHLLKLNDRYSLQLNKTYAKGEELNFKLIDHYQTNQERYVDTSSGGEKFIISLALALGLSDLASNNVQINSLFIDEGFGTLDNNTLETVISTLETLQSQGKIIGVISHVESLKERISTQIQVHKKSNGVSEIELVY